MKTLEEIKAHLITTVYDEESKQKHCRIPYW